MIQKLPAPDEISVIAKRTVSVRLTIKARSQEAADAFCADLGYMFERIANESMRQKRCGVIVEVRKG